MESRADAAPRSIAPALCAHVTQHAAVPALTGPPTITPAPLDYAASAAFPTPSACAKYRASSWWPTQPLGLSATTTVTVSPALIRSPGVGSASMTWPVGCLVLSSLCTCKFTPRLSRPASPPLGSDPRYQASAVRRQRRSGVPRQGWHDATRAVATAAPTMSRFIPVPCPAHDPTRGRVPRPRCMPPS